MTNETQKLNYASAAALINKATTGAELDRAEQIITNVYDNTNELTHKQFYRLCEMICDHDRRVIAPSITNNNPARW